MGLFFGYYHFWDLCLKLIELNRHKKYLTFLVTVKYFQVVPFTRYSQNFQEVSLFSEKFRHFIYRIFPSLIDDSDICFGNKKIVSRKRFPFAYPVVRIDIHNISMQTVFLFLLINLQKLTKSWILDYPLNMQPPSTS